jgi:hypothetical protein
MHVKLEGGLKSHWHRVDHFGGSQRYTLSTAQKPLFSYSFIAARSFRTSLDAGQK